MKPYHFGGAPAPPPLLPLLCSPAMYDDFRRPKRWDDARRFTLAAWLAGSAIHGCSRAPARARESAAAGDGGQAATNVQDVAQQTTHAYRGCCLTQPCACARTTHHRVPGTSVQHSTTAPHTRPGSWHSIAPQHQAGARDRNERVATSTTSLAKHGHHDAKGTHRRHLAENLTPCSTVRLSSSWPQRQSRPNLAKETFASAIRRAIRRAHRTGEVPAASQFFQGVSKNTILNTGQPRPTAWVGGCGLIKAHPPANTTKARCTKPAVWSCVRLTCGCRP